MFSDPDIVGGLNTMELEGLYIGITSFFIVVGDCDKSFSRSSKELSSSFAEGELTGDDNFDISEF